MQHRAGSERVLTLTEQENKAQTSTHVISGCFIALKCAVLDNQSAAVDINCSSLKQFEFPPRHIQEMSRGFSLFKKARILLTNVPAVLLLNLVSEMVIVMVPPLP